MSSSYTVRRPSSKVTLCRMEYIKWRERIKIIHKCRNRCMVAWLHFSNTARFKMYDFLISDSSLPSIQVYQIQNWPRYLLAKLHQRKSKYFDFWPFHAFFENNFHSALGHIFVKCLTLGYSASCTFSKSVWIHDFVSCKADCLQRWELAEVHNKIGVT